MFPEVPPVSAYFRSLWLFLLLVPQSFCPSTPSSACCIHTFTYCTPCLLACLYRTSCFTTWEGTTYLSSMEHPAAWSFVAPPSPEVELFAYLTSVFGSLKNCRTPEQRVQKKEGKGMAES
uniref:Kazal-like domain-containing protein n=1 Tax=Palpitomonas bilix TaxID=652834 RepID=A0A7S3GGG4_9EUKA